MVAAQQRLTDSGYFDSAFISIDAAGDPAAAPVLVQVRGRGGKLSFGPYVVAYDLGKKTFSQDLTKFNAKAIP